MSFNKCSQTVIAVLYRCSNNDLTASVRRTHRSKYNNRQAIYRQ